MIDFTKVTTYNRRREFSESIRVLIHASHRTPSSGLQQLMERLDNANPVVFDKMKEREVLPEEENDEIVDKFDSREIYDIRPPSIVPQIGHSLSP